MISISTDRLSINKLIVLALSGYISLIVLSCAPICPSSPDQYLRAFGVSQQYFCQAYTPSMKHAEELPFSKRVVSKTQSGLTVTAAVLTDKESREVFSLNLAKKDIQPVWLKIENNTDQLFTFLPIALDPGYFFPYEAAYMVRTNWESINNQINEYFKYKSIGMDIKPGDVESGYIYTRKDPAVKYINVMLFAPKTKKTFVFYLEVPGIKTDFQRVDFDSLYAKKEIIDLKDKNELREVLEKIPCCTTRKDGSGQNDPLNFVLIGQDEDISSAFILRGWDVTEPIYLGSAWRAVKAFFSHFRYRTSPMSRLFFYERGQDIGLQKARSTIHERNHLRLWLTPYRYEGKPIWIGTVSRDTGSYFTTKTPWFTAHAIDPNLDEARSYLVQDLLFSQGVSEFGYVQYTKPSNRKNPRFNFMEQQWWSDGRRAVLIFGSEHTPLTELKLIPWVWKEDPSEMINK